MSNYLRNRPFMVISYSYVLTNGQKPNTPGFGQKAHLGANRKYDHRGSHLG